MVQDTYDGRPIVSCIWSIKRRYVQRPWTTFIPDFKVMPLFDAEYLRNSMRYRHSFSGILMWTYTRRTQQCHFEWSWVTQWNSQRHEMSHTLCDSWASCLCYHLSFLLLCRKLVLPKWIVHITFWTGSKNVDSRLPFERQHYILIVLFSHTTGS